MNDIFQSTISYKSGRLRDAEQLYKSVLAEEPAFCANHDSSCVARVGRISIQCTAYLRLALDQDPTVNHFGSVTLMLL